MKEEMEVDEIKVSSKLLRRIIANFVEKTVREKLGVGPKLQFIDPIKVTYDEKDGVYLHLNVDVLLNADEFETLVESVL